MLVGFLLLLVWHSAPLSFAPSLGFMGLHGEPLHVLWRVWSRAFERDYVVNLPADAGQAVALRGWACLLPDELVASRRTTRNARS